MKKFTTKARRTLLDRPPWLTVETHTVGLPNGEEIAEWDWVITPDFVNMAVIDQAGRYLCFRQIKYAIAGESYAPVGGYLDPGEAPLLAAQRELREELGYAADEWIALGEYAVDGNRGAGRAYLFVARGAHQVAEPHEADLEQPELVLLSRAEVRAALAAGEFRCLAWVAVMSLALALEAEMV